MSRDRYEGCFSLPLSAYISIFFLCFQDIARKREQQEEAPAATDLTPGEYAVTESSAGRNYYSGKKSKKARR